MISERKFAASHASFWRSVMPLGESLTRTINVNRERYAPPLPVLGDPIRNSLISELSFRLFGASLERGVLRPSSARISNEEIDQFAEDVRVYVSLLERGAPFAPVTANETAEAMLLGDRLADGLAFAEKGKRIEFRPKFVGCGVLDDCEGDLIVGKTLYEVKNVDRGFRIADVRQLLVYCALSAAAREERIEAVGLLNARDGVVYRLPLNTLAIAASGVPAGDLLGDVINYVIGDRSSR